MKKILIATVGLSSIGQTGGISSYVHDLATNLQIEGFDVYVYLIKENNNIQPKSVNYNYKLYDIPATYKEEELVVKVIFDDINKLNPDIIINNDVSYLAGLWPVLKTEIIKISVMHGFIKRISLSNSRITGKISALNHDYIDYIVCQNSKMVKDCREKYNIPEEKVVFIPQSFKHDDKLGNLISSDILNIIFANGLNKRKGSDVMLAIASLLKESNIKFLLRWCMVVKKMSLRQDHRFKIYGALTRDQFINKLKKSDIIIIPTRLDTGPMLVVEAMANGVIPICNNLEASAIPDILINGINGFTVDDNNPQEYLEIILKLSENKQLREEIKKNMRNYYIDNLTEKHQVENYKKLFVKQEIRQVATFTRKNIVFSHVKKTSHLSKFSLKRIYLKIRYILELPLYSK